MGVCSCGSENPTLNGGGGGIRGSWILQFRFVRVSDLRSFLELNFRSLIFMRDLRS